MHDDGQRPMIISHLSDSDDLKLHNLLIYLKLPLIKSLLQENMSNSFNQSNLWIFGQKNNQINTTWYKLHNHSVRLVAFF